MATIAVPPLRRGSSTRRWALLGAAGAGAALAWFTLSLFAAPAAHAADDSDNPLGSLLGGVSSSLSTVTTPVLEPVADILAPVAQAVAPAVDVVAPPLGEVVTSLSPVLEPLAPAGDIVAPIGAALGDTVGHLAPVLTPVTGALQPVVDAAAPVTGAVSALPVVDHLIPPVTGVVPPLGGAASALDPSAVVPQVVNAAASGTWQQMTGQVAAASRGLSAAFVSATALAGAATGITSPAGGSGGPAAPFSALTLESTTLISSGSVFNFGASAVLAFGAFAACRAWLLRRTPTHQHALPAPFFDTDVSPD